MKPLKLNSVIPGAGSPMSAICVKDQKDETICFIYADGNIQTFSQLPYYLEEIETFVLIADNFYLFYNNIKTQ